MSRQYRKVAALGILALSFLLSPLASTHAATIATTADTALRRSSPNAPGNKDRWMHVNAGTKVLLAFDTGSSGFHLQKATLRVTSVPAAFRHAGIVEVVEVVAPWQDTTATWNKTPPTGRVIASVQVDASQKNSVLAFDVTTIVQHWLSNPSQNHGLMLRSGDAINIAFYSVESMGGAFAATLELVTPNLALVASHGGDYDNPADAADDVAAWCSPPLPCAILVRPGLYLVDRTITLAGVVALRGSGSAVTELRAAAGVSPVVLATSQETLTSVSDVAIVNHQVGGKAGAVGIDGSEPTGGGTPLQLGDVRISVAADGPSHAASAGELRVFDSEIEVASTAGVALTGISGAPLYSEDLGGWSDGTVSLVNSRLLVTGGVEAFGARGSTVDLRSSYIRVRASATAHEVTGVSTDDHEDGTVVIRDSTVDTRGSGGRQTAASVAGISECSGRITDSELLSDGATPDSSALQVMNNAGPCDVTVSNSRLQGGLELPIGTPETVLTFDNDVFEGAKFVRATAGYVVHILNSRVEGSIEFGGSELYCNNVVDAEFEPRDSNCQPAGQ